MVKRVSNNSGMNFRNAFPQFNNQVKRSSAMDKCIRASKLVDAGKRQKFLDECIKRYNKSLLKLKAKKNKDKTARLNVPKSIRIKEDRKPRVVSTRRRRELIDEIDRRLSTLRNETTNNRNQPTTQTNRNNRQSTNNREPPRNSTRRKKIKSNKQRQADKEEQKVLTDIKEELEEDKLTARELRNYDKLISVLNDNILDSDDLQARRLILNEFSEFFDDLNESENKLEDIQQLIADMRNMEDDEIEDFLYQEELNNLKDEERLTKKNIDKLQDRLMGKLRQPITNDSDVESVLGSINSEQVDRASEVSSLIGSDELRFDPVPPNSALTARGA